MVDDRWWVGHCSEIAAHISLMCNDEWFDFTPAQIEQVLIGAAYMKPKILRAEQNKRLGEFLKELEEELGPVDPELLAAARTLLQ